MTRKYVSRLTMAALVAAGALGVGGLATAPSFAAGDAEIYIVQGLPGKVVDVAVDGDTKAKDVKTAAVVGPFKISSGQRKITISSGGSVVVERMITVKAKWNADVVVHLPAQPSGKPVMTMYKNDLSAVPKDKASLTVAHTAAVPPADIRVNGKVLFANVENGESLHVVVPVATYSVAIVPAGKTKPVYLGPVDLTVHGGSLNAVYAVGDPRKKTMNVAVHVISTAPAGSRQPSTVDTGTGGQAAGKGSDLYVNLVR